MGTHTERCTEDCGTEKADKHDGVQTAQWSRTSWHFKHPVFHIGRDVRGLRRGGQSSGWEQSNIPSSAPALCSPLIFASVICAAQVENEEVNCWINSVDDAPTDTGCCI